MGDTGSGPVADSIEEGGVDAPLGPSRQNKPRGGSALRGPRPRECCLARRDDTPSLPKLSALELFEKATITSEPLRE